jgi:hypothetical protein
MVSLLIQTYAELFRQASNSSRIIKVKTKRNPPNLHAAQSREESTARLPKVTQGLRARKSGMDDPI